jgi:uncharacterized glyoxalase superfamily protein PhnB
MAALTPILVVEEIEPCLPFWTERLGFQKTTEVPHEGRLGFVILDRGGVEVMYQSKASVSADLPQLAGRGERAVLYMQVENIEELEAKMAGLEPVIPMRQTFYGAAEIGFADPAGNVVIFAMYSGY